MEKIKNIPLPLSGVMLAFATFGNLFATPQVHYFFGLISLILWVTISLKIIFHFKAAIKELENVNVFSTLPTYTMGSMVLTTYFTNLIPELAVILWWLFFIIQFIIILMFTWSHLIKDFQLHKVSPGWFVMYVGLGVAAVTAPMHDLIYIGQLVVYFVVPIYFILFGLMLIRLRKHGKPVAAAYPLMMIFAAPANLCLAGYLSSFSDVNLYLVLLLYILGFSQYVYLLFFDLRKIVFGDFYPSIAASTFPVVISATATKKLPFENGIFDAILYIQIIIAFLVISFVLFRFIKELRLFSK